MSHEAWPEILGEFRKHFEEPKHLPCSEWNTLHRKLPNGQPFRPWPWQTEILNAPDESDVNEIILEMASQCVGKSEILLGILCYKLVTQPADYLCVLPGLDQGQKWSRTRWAAAVKMTPILQALLPGEGKRTLGASGSRLLFKQLGNGSSLSICGSNSSAALAAASIRGLFFDETDLAKPELLGIGSPFANAARRLTSFADSFLVEASSPTLSDESRIDADYQRSDRRVWLIPCPSCGACFELRWANVVWDKTESGKHKPETAHVRCPSCNRDHQDNVRRLMVLNGHWQPENPAERRVRGYRMSAFNTLQPTRKGFASRLHEMTAEFLAAKNNPVTLQPWCNQVAGEVFVKEEVKGVPVEYLLERRENFFGSDELPDPATSILPEKILLLTAAVDVQANRLESLIAGWSLGRSCYFIDHRIWPCNPSQGDGWRMLGDYLSQSWATKWASGKRLAPYLVFVDSGFLPQAVYDFCRGRHYHFPSKGISSSAMPWVESADKRHSVYHVHTDAGKYLFYSRLAIHDRSADGYIHLHLGLGQDFCEQLVSEVATREPRSGRLVFRLKKEASNEGLDLAILNLAAEYQLRIPYQRLETERTGVEPKTETAPPSPPPRRPRRPHSFWGPGGITGDL